MDTGGGTGCLLVTSWGHSGYGDVTVPRVFVSGSQAHEERSREEALLCSVFNWVVYFV